MWLCGEGIASLLEVLEPVYKHRVPLGVLLKIQTHFHGSYPGAERIRFGARACLLRLPELEPLLELDRPQMWFRGPRYVWRVSATALESAGVEAKLVSESLCAVVVGGSGQRHEINL